MALTAQTMGLTLPPTTAEAATVPVRLLRAICVQGVRVEPGTVLTVAPRWAAELCFAGKADRWAEQAPEPTKPAAKKAAAPIKES